MSNKNPVFYLHHAEALIFLLHITLMREIANLWPSVIHGFGIPALMTHPDDLWRFVGCSASCQFQLSGHPSIARVGLTALLTPCHRQGSPPYLVRVPILFYSLMLSTIDIAFHLRTYTIPASPPRTSIIHFSFS